MTDDYTPTTEQIRDGFAHDPEVEYYNPDGYDFEVAANKRAFNDWLAAHDREVAEKAWGDGFDSCAHWWEIHHHATVRDESNPYREQS